MKKLNRAGNVFIALGILSITIFTILLLFRFEMGGMVYVGGFGQSIALIVLGRESKRNRQAFYGAGIAVMVFELWFKLNVMISGDIYSALWFFLWLVLLIVAVWDSED